MIGKLHRYFRCSRLCSLHILSGRCHHHRSNDRQTVTFTGLSRIRYIINAIRHGLVSWLIGSRQIIRGFRQRRFQRTVSAALFVERIATGNQHIMHISIREFQTGRMEEHCILQLRMAFAFQHGIRRFFHIRQGFGIHGTGHNARCKLVLLSDNAANGFRIFFRDQTVHHHRADCNKAITAGAGRFKEHCALKAFAVSGSVCVGLFAITDGHTGFLGRLCSLGRFGTGRSRGAASKDKRRGNQSTDKQCFR